MPLSETPGNQTTRSVSAGRRSSTRLIAPDGRTDIARLESIGFDPGTGGGTTQPTPPPRPDFGPDPGIVNPPSTGERPCTQWVIWEVWFTRGDERVCPICGPLHGRQYLHGEGPQPPLHGGCRCFRRESRRECVSRRAGGAGAGENF